MTALRCDCGYEFPQAPTAAERRRKVRTQVHDGGALESVLSELDGAAEPVERRPKRKARSSKAHRLGRPGTWRTWRIRPVREALAYAIRRAADEGRWDVVMELAGVRVLDHRVWDAHTS